MVIKKLEKKLDTDIRSKGHAVQKKKENILYKILYSFRSGPKENSCTRNGLNRPYIIQKA